MLNKLVLIVFITLMTAGTLLADVVTTTDGRRLEGKIVKETDEYIEIKMKYGSIKIPQSKVEKIERGKTKLDEYEEKLAEIDKKDKEHLLKLAEWCKKNGLNSERKELLRKVLKLDPANDTAGKALGYEKKEGTWVKPVRKPRPTRKESAKPVPPRKEKEKPLNAEPGVPVYDPDNEEAKELKQKSEQELWQVIAVAQKNWNASRAYLATGILIREKKVNSPRVWLKVGWALGEMGDYKENIRCANKAYRLAPPDGKSAVAPHVYQQIGYALDRMGEYKKAEEFYLKSYNLNKSYWWISFMVASNYKHLEKYDLAEQYADISLSVSPNRIGPSIIKATCLVLRGGKQEGEQLLRACEGGIAKGVADGEPGFEHGGGQGIYLAEAWCALGNKERALLWLEEHVYGYCKFEKDRNHVRRELGRLPLLTLLRGEERFQKIAEIPEELDEDKWEYGLVKKGDSIKSGQKVAKLKKKKKHENVVPPVLAPKDWLVIRTKHYTLISNSLRERLKELACRLELILFEYRKFFNAKTEIKETYTVKLFKDRASFKKYAKEHGVPGFAAAYFSYSDKELVLYDTFSMGFGLKTFKIVYHEAAHQFIWHHLGEDVPIWFHEAVAQYFESASYSKGRFKVGSKLYEKVQTVQNALMSNDVLHISDMLNMSQAEFYSGNVTLNYATAYYFLYYLLNYSKDTKKLLSNYVKTLKEKGSSKEAYDATFGKVDIDQLQKNFERYILKGK
jgi:tetratricopeptide (TPR) repeat protein